LIVEEVKTNLSGMGKFERRQFAVTNLQEPIQRGENDYE